MSTCLLSVNEWVDEKAAWYLAVFVDSDGKALYQQLPSADHGSNSYTATLRGVGPSEIPEGMASQEMAGRGTQA